MGIKLILRRIFQVLPIELKFRLRAWILRVKPVVGRNAYIHSSVQMLGASAVEIGNNSVVSDRTWINVNHRVPGKISVSIKDNCFIGRENFFSSGNEILLMDYCLSAIGVSFICSSHISENPMVPYISAGTTMNQSIRIGVNCFIGANASIVGNVSIGHGSIVSANAVVVSNVPPFSIVVGSPAKVVRRYSFTSTAWVGPDQITDSDSQLMPDEDAYLAVLRAGFPRPDMPYVAAGQSLGDF